MSERVKEYLVSAAFFIMAIACMYGSMSGRAIGHWTAEKTRQTFIIVGFTLLFTTAISLIGNFRLNVWLRPEEFIEAQIMKNSPKSQTYVKERPFFRILFTLWAIIVLGYIFYVVKY